MTATLNSDTLRKRAAEKMGGLHDVIKATGYAGKDLETYRCACFFACLLKTPACLTATAFFSIT
jgi:hypothetical protein